MSKGISVIILSKNNGPTLGATLASIIRSKVPEGYSREIIVVDAHSNDNTPEILKKYSKWIKVVYDEGKGIGIARNIGVKASKGDIIAFVDADTIVGREHFVKIVEAMKKGADIVDVKGEGKIKGLKLPKVSELELAVWEHGRAYRGKMLENRAFAGGAFISFKREVFDAVGGFWEYPPYGGDDMDFSFRAWLKGYKIHVATVGDSISLPRFSLTEIIKEQKGWGKGYAYIIAKYRGTFEFWKAFKFSKKIYKIFGRNTWIYMIFRLVMAPLGALNLFLKTKKPSILPYYIARRYAFLYGLLKELPKAMKYFSKQIKPR